ADARVLLLDQLGDDTMIAAAVLARDLGVPTVMDFEWPSAPRVREMMDLAGHLLLPYDFAAEFTGLTDPRAIAAALHHQRPCTAITRGREGCYYASPETRGEVVHLPAVPVVTLETTGCGDVFHGAYAAALSQGRSAPSCLEFASAAAAVYASRRSAGSAHSRRTHAYGCGPSHRSRPG
ncbi:MAG: PfkB family carbohydrate kinase, partial [Acidobacteria bacterium]|nr:PfkB family carbohydrate kinase [Acidobacteriota bacterium]